MANRHFGKFADAWKHLALSEVITHEHPRRYAETDAGSATYPMVLDDERRFGISHFIEAALTDPALAQYPYLELVGPFLHGAESLYPGSAGIAMTALGPDASYLFCDLDPASISTLHDRARRLWALDTAVVHGDGMQTVARWIGESDGISAVVHVDPFDPDAQNSAGTSALTLAAEIISSEQILVYWYGYDEPAEAGWAYHTLRNLSGSRPMWCGDMMITDSADHGTSRRARRGHHSRHRLRRHPRQRQDRDHGRVRAAWRGPRSCLHEHDAAIRRLRRRSIQRARQVVDPARPSAGVVADCASRAS
ncbi:MAG: hypothetical protein ACRDK8_14790 [Solirubrobacteraceae bacterium]